MKDFNPENPVYYVYEHFSVIDGNVFYVGVGKKDRVFAQGEHRNKLWKKKVYLDGGFRFRILYKNITKREALDIERQVILKYGIENLCNIVGEEGNSTAFKKGLVPWNKGLTGKNAIQSYSYKPVTYNGIRFESISALISELGIGTSTYYRRLKKGVLDVCLHNSN